jgi:hypothetical protein
MTQEKIYLCNEGGGKFSFQSGGKHGFPAKIKIPEEVRTSAKGG